MSERASATISRQEEERDETAERHAPITQSEAEAEAAFLKRNNSLGKETSPDRALFTDGRPDYGFDFTKN
jgi:hypothetical protein